MQSKDQLDILHVYSELEEIEKMLENMRDSKLRNIYGQLPSWRRE